MSRFAHCTYSAPLDAARATARTPRARARGAGPGVHDVAAPTPPSPPALGLGRALGLLDGHGTELLGLARLITGSAETARSVVSAVLLEADRRDDEVPGTAEETRRSLVARIFGACWAAPDEPKEACAAGSPQESIEWVTRTCAEQRAALGLYLYGGLDIHEVGALLGTSPQSACVLVLAAAKDLADDDLGLGHRIIGAGHGVVGSSNEREHRV